MSGSEGLGSGLVCSPPVSVAGDFPARCKLSEELTLVCQAVSLFHVEADWQSQEAATPGCSHAVSKWECCGNAA